MTHETRIKDAVNMEDLICLLATVRTLNDVYTRTYYITGGNPAIVKQLLYLFWTEAKDKKSKQPGKEVSASDTLFLFLNYVLLFNSLKNTSRPIM